MSYLLYIFSVTTDIHIPARCYCEPVCVCVCLCAHITQPYLNDYLNLPRDSSRTINSGPRGPFAPSETTWDQLPHGYISKMTAGLLFPLCTRVYLCVQLCRRIDLWSDKNL